MKPIVPNEIKEGKNQFKEDTQHNKLDDSEKKSVFQQIKITQFPVYFQHAHIYVIKSGA